MLARNLCGTQGSGAPTALELSLATELAAPFGRRDLPIATNLFQACYGTDLVTTEETD